MLTRYRSFYGTVLYIVLYIQHEDGFYVSKHVAVNYLK